MLLMLLLILLILLNNILLILLNNNNNNILGGECEGGTAQSGKSDEETAARVAVLRRIGVMGRVVDEIAGLPWASVEYLERWEEWMLGQKGVVGVGLLVNNWRNGALAPGGDDEWREWRQRQRYAGPGVLT